VPFSCQNVLFPMAALSGVTSGALLAGGLAGRRGAGRSLKVVIAPRCQPCHPRRQLPTCRFGFSEQLDLERELVAAVQNFAGSAADRGVKLEVAIQPNLTVWADGTRFGRSSPSRCVPPSSVALAGVCW
jgi:hypothetical protein